MIFSGMERKREILLGGIQRCWFIGSAPIETVSKDSCKQLPTSTARLHFWHIKYFIWTNRLWEDYMYIVQWKLCLMVHSIISSVRSSLRCDAQPFEISLNPTPLCQNSCFESLQQHQWNSVHNRWSVVAILTTFGHSKVFFWPLLLYHASFVSKM